jgi:hypothetical protein
MLNTSVLHRKFSTKVCHATREPNMNGMPMKPEAHGKVGVLTLR